MLNRFLNLSLIFSFLPLLQVLAEEGAAAPQKEGWNPLVGILLMLAVFFFLIILPQSRKAKKQTQFLTSLQKGDDVLTQSGLYGKIYGLADRIVTLEVAPNVRVRIDRQSISSKTDASGAKASGGRK